MKNDAGVIDAGAIDCWVDQELFISPVQPPVTLAQLIEAGAMTICDGMTPERAAAIAQDFIDEAALERARHKRLEADYYILLEADYDILQLNRIAP